MYTISSITKEELSIMTEFIHENLDKEKYELYIDSRNSFRIKIEKDDRKTDEKFRGLFLTVKFNGKWIQEDSD